jgi:hypothetical protein
MSKRMSMFAFLGAVVAVLVGGLTMQGYVWAQEPDPPQPPGGYGRRAWGDGEETFPPYHEEMEAAIAEILGISVEELEAAHAEGKTLYDLTVELGLDFEEVREAVRSAREEIVGWSGGPGWGFGRGWMAGEADGWRPCFGARGGWTFDEEAEDGFRPNAWGRGRGRRGWFRR